MIADRFAPHDALGAQLERESRSATTFPPTDTESAARPEPEPLSREELRRFPIELLSPEERAEFEATTNENKERR